MSLRSRIAGSDGPGKSALPADEFLHPIPLAALLILVLNDWWLKPSGWATGFITGKLSDLAGLLFFPLLCTACFDCMAFAAHKLGLHTDFSLRRYKIAVAIACTGLGFALVKLSDSVNLSVVQALRSAGFDAVIVRDPSDLLTLPVLLVPWLVATRAIRRVPLGRLEVMLSEPRKADSVALLADSAACGADAADVASLAQAIDFYKESPTSEASYAVEQALQRVRQG